MSAKSTSPRKPSKVPGKKPGAAVGTKPLASTNPPDHHMAAAAAQQAVIDSQSSAGLADTTQE